MKPLYTNAENLEDEDDASILLSMCTSAPQLDVSIRCTVDAELEEECAVIAWKKDDLDQDHSDNGDDEVSEESEGSDASGSWRTETDDQDTDEYGGDASQTDCDDSEKDSRSSQSSNDDGNGTSSESGDQELVDEDFDDADDRPQYLFEVDRENVLESSLNSLENMSKWVPIAHF
jgi:hypothetical protein